MKNNRCPYSNEMLKLYRRLEKLQIRIAVLKELRAAWTAKQIVRQFKTMPLHCHRCGITFKLLQFKNWGRFLKGPFIEGEIISRMVECPGCSEGDLQRVES